MTTIGRVILHVGAIWLEWRFFAEDFMSQYAFSAAVVNHPQETFVLAENLPLVLFFYPRDNTPGCTVENNEFNQLAADFLKAGFKVAGISRDNLASHRRFCEKYALTIPLLADPDERICQQFDVIKAKTMYGKPVRGIERSTFVFDQKGEVIQEWRKVKAESHAQMVLDFVRQL